MWNRTLQIKEDAIILCADPHAGTLIKKLLRQCEKKLKKTPPIISASFEVEWELKHLGISVDQTLDLVLPRDRYASLHREAEELARKWYRSEGEDLTRYESFSLGSLVEWELTFYLYGVIKQYEALKAFYQRRRSSQFIVIQPIDREGKGLPNLGWVSEAYHCFSALRLLKMDFPKVSFVYFSNSIPLVFWMKRFLKFPAISFNWLRQCIGLFNSWQRAFRENRKKQHDHISHTVVFFPLYTAYQNRSVLSFLAHRLSIRRLVLSLGKGNRESIEGSHLIGLQNYGNREASRWRSVTRTVFKEKWEQFQKEAESHIQFRGRSLWPAVEKEWQRLFENRFPEMVERGIRFRDLLYRERVSLFVVAVDVKDPEKHLVQLANREGVQTLLIQHGLMTSPTGYRPLSCRNVAVWGEVSKRRFVNEGISEERVVVTGCPRFDRYANIGQSHPPDQRRGKFVLVLDPFISGNVYFDDESFSDRDVEIFAKSVLSAMRSFPEKELWIKIRPECPPHMTLIKRLLRELGVSNIRILAQEDPIFLLKNCELLITTNSTMGLEASLFGIPLLVANYPGACLNDYYVNQDIALKVPRPEEMVSSLKWLLQDHVLHEQLTSARRKFILDHAFLQDGRSSQRVCHLIQSLLDEGRGRSLHQTPINQEMAQACNP